MRKDSDNPMISSSTSGLNNLNDSSDAFCPLSPRLINPIDAKLNQVSDETKQQNSTSPMQGLIPSPAFGYSSPHPAQKLKLLRPESYANHAIIQLISENQSANNLLRGRLINSPMLNYINGRTFPVTEAQRRDLDGRAMAMASKQTFKEALQMQQNRRFSTHHSPGRSPSRFSQTRDFNSTTQSSPVRSRKPRSKSYGQLANAETHSLEKIDEGDSDSPSPSSMKSQLALLMKSWRISSGGKRLSSSASAPSLSSLGSGINSPVSSPVRNISTNYAVSANYALNHSYSGASPRRSVSDGYGYGSVKKTKSRPELRRSRSLTSRFLTRTKDILKCKPASPANQAEEVSGPSPPSPARRSSAWAGSGDEWSVYNNYYYGAPYSPSNANAPPGLLAPNAMHHHFHTNKVRSHELRRKTFLPYRQSFLGCLGGGAFSSMSGHNTRFAQQAW